MITSSVIFDNAEAIFRHSIHLNISLCSVTMLAGIIPFIDQHSWIVGLFGITLTWLTTVVFGIVDRIGKRRKRD